MLEALAASTPLLLRFLAGAAIVDARRWSLRTDTRLVLPDFVKAAVTTALVSDVADPDVRVQLCRPPSAPTAFGWRSGAEAIVYAVVPPTWMVLAAAGLGAVGGHLVLAVTGPVRGGRARALAAAWGPLREGRRDLVERSIVVERQSGRWSLGR